MTSKYFSQSLAIDYDVDAVTGFLPREPPLTELPRGWLIWESLLRSATAQSLVVGDTIGITHEQKSRSEVWRQQVRKMPLFQVDSLEKSVEQLRRAHLVLTCLLAFYIQTLPPESPIHIPRPLSIPLLKVSRMLDLPPILTYSDTVLYNWQLHPLITDANAPPTVDTVDTLPLFTHTRDEVVFYLASAQIEIRGAEALHLIGDIIAQMELDHQQQQQEEASSIIPMAKIESGLRRMAVVIDDLRKYLLGVRNGCSPDTYYNVVRPWFRGEDSDPAKRKWVFEGVGESSDLEQPRELSGPSAGQSTVIHVLDAFLGVTTTAIGSGEKPSFMSRMRAYMPVKHRAFLDYLANHPAPLRQYVEQSNDADLKEAFNCAVQALKEFRDTHLIIVVQYIVGPARSAEKRMSPRPPYRPLLGTGGSELMAFLKGLRKLTVDTLISGLPMYRRRTP